MSILQFFRILWARRMLVVYSTVGVFAAALLVGLLLPPRYEATSRLILDIVKPDPVTGEVMSSSWARAYVSTQKEIIRDYRVAGKVADAAGWASSPELAAEYRASGSASDMDFRRWLAQKVIDNTTVSLVEGSNILEISYSSPVAETAAQMADLLRETYIQQTISFRRDAANRNAEWFRGQTESLRTQLIAAEKRKNDFERENGIVLTVNDVDADEARLAALANSSPVAPAMVMGNAPAPSSAQLSQIDAAIAAASRTLGPNHPDLLQLRQQRVAIAQSVARETAAQASGSSGPSIGALYSAQQAKVLQKAGKADEAKRLAANVAVLRDQYAKTVARATELEQEAASNEAGMTLLGDAVAPQSPSFPNMPLIIIGSIGLGLGMGVLASLLIELLYRKVRCVEDLRLASVPVLGAMAAQEKQPRRRFGWLPGRRALAST